MATQRNEKGRRLAAARVRDHLLPLLGECVLATMGADDIRAYRLALERKRLAPLTVTHLLSDLRALLLWACEAGLLSRSPFPRRVMPRVPERAPRGLSRAEVASLVVLRLLMGTGLRWAEACRARAEHVRQGFLVVDHTKSGRVRRIALPRALALEIASHRGALVPYAVGSPGTFARTVRAKSGVTDFGVHRCRHTFAMHWLAGGGSLAVLQELLGHREIGTTMRYARVADDLVRREMVRVERRWAQRGR